MVYQRITHAAIHVTDLIDAEGFYTDLFDTDVSYRQTTVDGEWHTLAHEHNWEAAEEAGYQPKMSFIRKDEFFLALILDDTKQTSANPQKYHLGLEMAEEELRALLKRARDTACSVLRESEKTALVEDIYGYEWDIDTAWEIRIPDERSENWIEL